MRRCSVAIIITAFTGATFSGCLGEPIGPESSMPAGHSEHPETTPPASEPGAPDVVLEAHAGMPEKDLELHPSPLEVPLGSLVEIRVANAGQTQHTFTIHEFDADTGLMAPGEEKTLKFRAGKAGSFEIMCDAPGHYEAGMKATLEVAA